jgi:hypothetical protein
VALLHPAIAYLALGLAIGPLAIHLLTRRRHRREPWAAMQFLVAAHGRIRRRLNLRHYLMLALRTAAVLLLGLALARPGLSEEWAFPGAGAPRCARIIVLDDTLSMRARHAGGESSFDAARKLAKDLIASFPQADPAALLTLSMQSGGRSPQLVSIAGDLIPELQSIAPTYRSGDMVEALRAAADLLAETRSRWQESRVYLISDFDNAAMGQLKSLSEKRDLVESVGGLVIANTGPAIRENAAIHDLRREGEIVGANLAVGYAVEAANYSTVDIADGRVAIFCNGKRASTVSIGRIPAGGRATGHFELTFDRPGPCRVVAELLDAKDDALSVDNTRYLSEMVPDQVPVLLVEGQGGLPEPQQELLYVRTALGSVGDRVSPIFGVRTILPQQIGQVVLADQAVIVLGDVSNTSAESVDQLERFVNDGGGLVIFCGEQSGAKAEVGKSALDRLLIDRFERFEHIEGDVVTLGLRVAAPDHPCISEIAAHGRGGLGSVHVTGRWRSKPVENEIGATTLIAFTDGEPAIRVATKGRGRIVTFATGANMQWSNLPAKPDFVPLILNLVSFAAGGQSTKRDLEVGEKMEMPIAMSDARREHVIQRPDSRKAQAAVEMHDGRAALVYSETDEPGVYSARSAAGRAEFAVNVGQAESDLRSGDLKGLASKTRGGISLMEPSAVAQARTTRIAGFEVSGAFMILLLVVVMIETFAAEWFGRRT